MRNVSFTRRAALALPLGIVGLAGCASTDTSARYDTGYVEGSGVSTEIAVDKRGDAYDFSGETFSGEPFTLSEKRGAPVVLNVWYASCAPCRKEAPDLVKLHETYASKGVTFVGVNVRDEAGPAQAFEQKFSIPYPSIPDRDGTIMYALRGQVSPNAVPSTLVFDAKGRVAARISGLADPSILGAMIDRVLSE
ncbi:TlpA disulfide reductase family protein [Dermabacter hominis]|uniref:TlpA family protein disulfide reductase n=1 Tax=Dermabacter TaxID=36739 RepID=UPI002913BEA5|nr:TlpA disulfide reductase family protein [Dermabacter sp.]MDK8802617.1 TlpA disulfide reductase family protein [Dermabacter hominis]MDU4923501.1 TlpA disulfide reductase family protein [Dermabacter sp.]